ncbi:MAG: D-Ala-D-Ala carboxypeptidase family metallohydrolase [Abyssibacter sp.]|uniref:D-Ala-D-Ala carboxypeptidase family metallohydrolase n=1 Tax=Abyssibacter sp. TaxID=2320200 RepID=UPI00321BFEC7
MTPRRLMALTAFLFTATPLAAQDGGLPVEPPPPAQVTQQASAALSLRIGDDVVPYPVFGLYVMPGEQRVIQPVLQARPGRFEVTASAGSVTPLAVGTSSPDEPAWTWTAPETPGPATITVQRRPDGALVTLNALVMTPASELKNGRLGGFRIGQYPNRPLKGRTIYAPPKGFVEVTADTAQIQVSPHFKLGEFVAKQAGGYPKYLVLRERLLLKLEMIVEQLTDAGYQASGLHVMSGYRTPYYNRSIGNVPYSRHVWGGAADIFVDEAPRDGVMDDLNGDGRITVADARVIYDRIDELSTERWYQPFIGGMGLYGPKPGVRGPFVHVDVRGYRARW